ncbi:MAG: hypothetical protein PHS93_08055 [Candidatus Omnitrophica bacterium]|nr:hypothetical protein [Candidatus Omnitrophota bacterium]MDD5353095.1 hypothetical protein [Candidatus Omnitrophota bacterium]
MKVKISFEIEYHNPTNIRHYDGLMEIIKNFYENEMPIPCRIMFKELSQIKITDDYKSPEKE